MIIGERRSKHTADSYAQNNMRAYAEAFSDVTKYVLNEAHCDLFSNPTTAIMNQQADAAMKQFFVENSCDTTGMSAAELEDHQVTMEAQYENDREAILEHTSVGEMNPIVGMTFPIHKYILMNMVFDKGAIPKIVAQAPKFTLTMENRILVDTKGNEIDMFFDQNKMTAAINETAAPTVIEFTTLPVTDETEIVVDKLKGTTMDSLSIETYISAVQFKDVYFEVGDILPNDEGYIEEDGEKATEAGAHDVWVRTNFMFTPAYSQNDYERTLMCTVKYAHKKNDTSTVTTVEDTDTIVGSMQNDRLNIAAIKGNVKGVRVTAKLDTSNARQTTCSVKWKSHTRIEEIPNAIPINTTISPEEVKDIAALYNVNQLTKIMSMTQSVLGNYKDDTIKSKLDDSYKRLDARSKDYGTFDFAPREGYALDHVEWRHKTFMDYFDTHVTKLLQVLNDPNMVITVFGNPDIVRKITPTEYSYQTPSSIGPVDLDYVKTVVTSDRRCYQFIGSDKMRDTTELIVVLCPRGSDRIMYAIYDYQMYISNEIRNADNPALPAIHAFERWKFTEFQPVQGRIQILNPTGIKPENYNSIRYKEVQ